jgi:hypothetical protein
MVLEKTAKGPPPQITPCYRFPFTGGSYLPLIALVAKAVRCLPVTLQME